ncbi:homoserine O-acetyltransferase MetX [Jatrophihabitans sp. YIM 134969]
MSRRYADIGVVALELGGDLDVRVAYETWGTPRRDDTGRIVNAVLVEHALTGDAHVAGPAGPDQPTPGWWGALIGPGGAVDTDRWFVVCANVLGGCRGTLGPATLQADGTRLGSRFPRVTVRDQVEVERRLADVLGVERFATVLGGSMGGMRALEWLVTAPERVGSALLLATCAASSADQIALQTLQIQAVTGDPAWRGGDYLPDAAPVYGLGLARRIAHYSYRSAYELEERFGRDPQLGEDPFAAPPDAPPGRFAVTSYLDHHAAKLVGRFDAGSYVTLTDAMNTHDAGRGRGGLAAALGGVDVPVVVGGIDSDRLYPIGQQVELAELLPRADGLDVVESPYGHDGFLIEVDAVAKLAARALELGAA